MHLVDSFWTSLTYVVGFLTLSPFKGPGGDQQAPLLTSPGASHPEYYEGPIFKPPSGRPQGPGSDFVCDYSKMVGWSTCSTPDNRGCWLRNNQTGVEYNITTNYEETNQTPTGITRRYVLDVTDSWINADGLNFTEAKIFNNMYPGPWIQACWGDNVTITVNNKLKSNGTSIHWHGIRQLLTMHMDGVNGITQCPIAPGDTFTYTWRALQYGSSWYHSHFSVQYADGAVGPLTLHGPSSAPYDAAKVPILMTDWGHNSAFRAIFTELDNPSTLLNGIGNVTRFNNSVVNQLPIPKPYTLNFDPPVKGRPKRYLLRLINTSFESTFVFSIDHHLLQIISADFVPIHPYFNTSVLVGIGQRYHVIVTAQPRPNGKPLPVDGNYWIRTWRADCFRFPTGDPGYEKSGIVRYGTSEALPTTSAWNGIALNCSDETYTSLKPILPWTVGKPANDPSGQVGENLTVQFKPGQDTIYPLAKFSVGGDNFHPLQIDYGDPIFLKLNYTGPWDPLWVVFPESYTDKDWVYMVIKGLKGSTAGAHPASMKLRIHLHGHDFALLQQIENATFPNKLNLKFDNPPRRDVVLLPTNGYAVIAFKTDNPGSWLMHCHIAFHASFGLALQFLERQKKAAEIWPTVEKSPALRRAQDLCNNWNKWWGNCDNWWPGDGSECEFGNTGFSPDSGI